MIIDARDDLEVVGEASGGREAVRLTRDLVPDVVLMDVRMPVVDGIEATRQIAGSSSGSRVLALTTWDVDAHVVAALRASSPVPQAGFTRCTRIQQRLLTELYIRCSLQVTRTCPCRLTPASRGFL